MLNLLPIFKKQLSNILIASFFLFLISGCATLPKPLEEIPALRDVPFSVVKNNPEKYKDVSLLWGGRIVSCTNTQDGTIFEILHFPLDREGYPEETDASEGRFIMASKNFLDCEVYSKGRLLTVVGRFKGFKEGRIDGMPYTFPLIEAQATYLWKNRWYRDYYWRPSIWFWYGSSPWYFDYGYPAWW